MVQIGLLENCRCIRCSSRRIEFLKAEDTDAIVSGALGCRDCGESYDSIWGVPFLGDFEPDDVLSWIEIAANARGFRKVNLSENDSHEYWERLLIDYDASEDRSTLLSQRMAHAEAAMTSFPNRYREWLEIKSLTADLVLTGKSILDVGAGSGFDSYRLAAAGARVTALEMSPLLIYQGQRRLPGIRWIGGLSHALPFCDESFDYVFCNSGLHHMRDIPGAIAEMLRVLKPNGWMVTTADPYRADFTGEDYELGVFDQNPSVLLGVNERIPKFNDFATTLEDYQDSLGIQLFTHGVRLPPLARYFSLFQGPLRNLGQHPLALRLQSFLMRKDQPADDFHSWHFRREARLLSKTGGAIAFKVQKRGRIDCRARMLGRPYLKIKNLAEWLDREDAEAGLAQIARLIPDEFVNLSFLHAEHSKFLLLNGWRSNRETPGMRQAYRRGRWFFRRSPGENSLCLEVLVPGQADASAASIAIFIDGRRVRLEELRKGVWTPVSVSLPPLSSTETFAVEVHLVTESKAFEENLISVRELKLA